MGYFKPGNSLFSLPHFDELYVQHVLTLFTAARLNEPNRRLAVKPWLEAVYFWVSPSVTMPFTWHTTVRWYYEFVEVVYTAISQPYRTQQCDV